MRTSFALLLFAAIVLCSCVDTPMGYLGLTDVDKPDVRITNLANPTVVFDTAQTFSVRVHAYDFFGISQIGLRIGTQEWRWYDTTDHTFNIPVDTAIIGRRITVTGFARDRASNVAYTQPYTVEVRRTIILHGTLDGTTLLDNSGTATFDLKTLFEDTLTHSTLTFALVYNSNERILGVHLTGDSLTLQPTHFLQGSSDVTIKISEGTRYIFYKFTVNVVLSGPIRKVYVPDATFRQVLYERYSFTNFQEDSVALDEADTLKQLYFSHIVVKNLEGLQAFTSLEDFQTGGVWNEYLISVDLTHQPNLREVFISDCYNLTDIQIPALPSMKKFGVGYAGRLDSLDMSHFPNLTGFFSYFSGPSRLNLYSNLLLDTISMFGSHLTVLDLSRNTNLKSIGLQGNMYLDTTYVWTLPLPNDVVLTKDTINTLVVRP